MEKKFKAQDKLARRAERKSAQENGTASIDESMVDEADDDDDDDEDSRD